MVLSENTVQTFPIVCISIYDHTIKTSATERERLILLFETQKEKQVKYFRNVYWFYCLFHVKEYVAFIVVAFFRGRRYPPVEEYVRKVCLLKILCDNVMSKITSEGKSIIYEYNLVACICIVNPTGGLSEKVLS